MNGVRISILVDDMVGGRNCWAEHGLALLVETPSYKVLFDTGQSGTVLLHNTAEIGINLEDLDAVVLSHGHYDHVNGLPALLARTGPLDVYAHPGVFAAKYAAGREGEAPRKIGPSYAKESIRAAGARLHLENGPVRLAEEIFLTGEIPSSTEFEEVPRGFLLEREGDLVTDFLLDEQAMAVRTEAGFVVLLGCGHPGVINAIKYCHRLAGQVVAVVGGLHLEAVPVERLQLTIHSLLNLGVKRIVPLHCTGLKARAAMAFQLGEAFLGAGAGDVIYF
ncbi:MAG: MBL fold metallo-hydrolase [Bacillota bacterium]